MGGKKKGGVFGSVTNAVSNVGKAVGKAVGDTGSVLSKALKDTKNTASKAVSDTGKSLEKAGQDVSKGAKTVYDKVIRPVANTASAAVTGGALSTEGDGYLQGNSVGGAWRNMFGIDEMMKVGSDFMSGRREDTQAEEDTEALTAAADAPKPDSEVTVDPYLAEELENARRRGRASTVLGGAYDTGYNTSARRTLFG